MAPELKIELEEEDEYFFKEKKYKNDNEDNQKARELEHKIWNHLRALAVGSPEKFRRCSFRDRPGYDYKVKSEGHTYYLGTRTVTGGDNDAGSDYSETRYTLAVYRGGTVVVPEQTYLHNPLYDAIGKYIIQQEHLREEQREQRKQQREKMKRAPLLKELEQRLTKRPAKR